MNKVEKELPVTKIKKNDHPLKAKRRRVQTAEGWHRTSMKIAEKKYKK